MSHGVKLAHNSSVSPTFLNFFDFNFYISNYHGLGQREAKESSRLMAVAQPYLFMLPWFQKRYLLSGKKYVYCTYSRLQKPLTVSKSLSPRNSIKQLIKACRKTDKAHTMETLIYEWVQSYSQSTEQLHDILRLSTFSEWKAYLRE